MCIILIFGYKHQTIKIANLKCLALFGILVSENFIGFFIVLVFMILFFCFVCCSQWNRLYHFIIEMYKMRSFG